MLKQFLDTLEQRQNLVTSRIEAISKEKDTLDAEIQHLIGLIRVYKSRDYDSIDEERRVTTSILKPSPPVEKDYETIGGKYHYCITYLLTEKKVLTQNQLAKLMTGMIGKPVHQATVAHYIKKLVDLGKVDVEKRKTSNNNQLINHYYLRNREV